MAPHAGSSAISNAVQLRSKLHAVSVAVYDYMFQTIPSPSTTKGFPTSDAGFLVLFTEADSEAFWTRITATSFIFVISLFAAWFPTLSKRISFLRIPRIVFFIGKHFGTGVILSTAFVHLLQDSFEALTSPPVQARWNIGEHVGLIVLCSLLAIFLIEYVSTSYVDRLHSYSSPLSSTVPTPRDESPVNPERARPASPKFANISITDAERTPLVATLENPTSESHPSPAISYGTVHTHACMHVDGEASSFFEGHHRHEPRASHMAHHERTRPATMYGPEEFGQCRPCGLGRVHHDESAHHHWLEEGEVVEEPHHHHHHHHHHYHYDDQKEHIKLGKKRQIVGILVLQLGIMIHSLVIGLTLAITSGSDFTSLLIAVTFHQLFEGLSLGIRIASLPSSQELGFQYLSVLKPVLASLFAITTPAGILLGMFIFNDNQDIAHMRLAQGLMSAISAGMLTYAAAVEMLAGDFVMDPILWRSGVGKQALALFSLAAGVTAMALVGS